jgi:hypothetical protein
MLEKVKLFKGAATSVVIIIIIIIIFTLPPQAGLWAA